MAVQDLQNKELKKHVSAIRVSNNVGLLARKIWNVLLLNAYETLTTQRKHSVPVSVLSEVIAYNSKSYSSLDDALKRLQTTLVEWDIGGGKTIEGTWLANMRRTQMVGGIAIVDGVIEYEFSEDLAKILYNPEIYQKISISQQKVFKSSHSLALWENCLRYVGVGSTGFSEVEEWRALLGATAKTYSQFKFFKSHLLNPAIKEVNELSNIELTLKTKKQGRRIAFMGFEVKEKSQKPLFIAEHLDGIRQTLEYEELLSFGIHKVQAIKWIEEHGFPYIRQKLDILKETQSQKELKNTSGFLVKAIKEDYQSAAQIEKAKQEEQQRKERAAKKKQEAEEKLQKEYESYQKNATEEFWNAFPPSIKSMVLKEFESSLDTFTLQKYKQYGLESAMVLAGFRNFLRSEHMQNGELLSLSAWKKTQKKDK